MWLSQRQKSLHITDHRPIILEESRYRYRYLGTYSGEPDYVYTVYVMPKGSGDYGQPDRTVRNWYIPTEYRQNMTTILSQK